MVELLPVGRLAAGSDKPRRMGAPPHAQMLLVEMAPPARTNQRPAETGSQGSRPGDGLQRTRSVGNSQTLRDATSLEESDAQPLWVYTSMGLCGGTKVTSALFNRRMRKTACPVVGKGRGAQSLRPHPIYNGKR